MEFIGYRFTILQLYFDLSLVVDVQFKMSVEERTWLDVREQGGDPRLVGGSSDPVE